MPRRHKAETKLDQMLDELLEEHSSPEAILGENGLLKQLTKGLVERALKAELSHHLEQETAEAAADEAANIGVRRARNSRNGSSKKTVITEQGKLPVDIPRDRYSTFEPLLVPKGRRRIEGLDEKVIALYARGNSTRDIQAQMEALYGVELSPTLIAQITDAVSDEVRQWQSRPLERVYPIVYLDAIHVKVRQEGRVSSHAIYVVLGVTLEGIKDVLGLWISANEGAKFWLKVLTDLKNRGVDDIVIACVDGLKGFPEAIEAVFPKTQVQLCIVHLIRNSLKFVHWQQRKAVADALKPIYRAATVEAAEDALTAFAETWDATYPNISAIWLRHWEHVIPFFSYPEDIRRVIYTTNAIESLNRSLRKVLKTKGALPSPESVFKLLYLALRNISQKWTRPIANWKAAMLHFSIEFPDRFPQ